MRLLHVTESYPPDYGGGAAIYVRDTARCLAGRGHAVCVLCAETTDGEEYSVRRERLDGVEVLRVNLAYFKEVDPKDGGSGFFVGVTTREGFRGS